MFREVTRGRGVPQGLEVVRNYQKPLQNGSWRVHAVVSSGVLDAVPSTLVG